MLYYSIFDAYLRATTNNILVHNVVFVWSDVNKTQQKITHHACFGNEAGKI